MKKIFISLIAITFLYSCGAGSEAGKVLRNEKNSNTDEFLVQKREPLTMPPDYNNLPKPGFNENKQKDEGKGRIQKILKVPEENLPSNKATSSVEESILNQINK